MVGRATGRTQLLGRAAARRRRSADAQMVARTEEDTANVASRLIPGQTPGVDVVSSLQRLVGNQATQQGLELGKTQPLARWTVPGPLSPPQTRTPAPAAPAITPEDRKRIESETAAEVVLAFTAFTDACQANLTALKAAAKQDAELAALAIDIASGFLAPAFANFVGAKFVKKAETKLAEEVSKKEVNRLISQSDFLKASFNAVAKGANYELKKHSTQLFGEAADDALLDGLKTDFQKNAVALAGKLPSMSNAELVATWVAYDPDAANVITYKASIKDLLDEFHGIVDLGVHKIFSDDTADQNHLLVNVMGYGYALTVRDMETLLDDAGPYEWIRPVHDYLLDEAKARAKSAGQKNVPTLRPWLIKNFPDNVKPWATP